VAGEASAFAAHLTRLTDHAALAEGKVSIELSGGGKGAETFVVDTPAVPGIFRPIVKASSAGVRKLTLRYESASLSELHELGEFTVFTSRAGADSAARPHEHGDGISYLLEQQWKVPFAIARVETRELRPSVPAFGRLVSPPESESVIVAPRDGRVLAEEGRFPRVGQEFSRGGALFSLTALPHEGSDLASLEEAVDHASIEVDSARRELDRLTPLLAQGVVSQKRVDAASSTLKSAQAKLRGARRRQGNLSQTQRVKANRDALAVPTPIDGALAELFVSPGTWVSKGDRLARVVDREHLVLQVGLPEAYLGQLREVSGAWFHLDGVPEAINLPATALLSVGTELDAEAGTLPVRFRVDNPQREFFAGMTTRAQLIVDVGHPGTAVPVSAIVEDAGHDVVYVQTGGESFERRPVKLGIRDGDFIEVLQGVEPGEWLVTRGAHGVKLASSSTEAVGHGHAH
jgi:RND family efflux transporter MFP subunit